MQRMTRRNFVKISGFGSLVLFNFRKIWRKKVPLKITLPLKPDLRRDPWIELNLDHLAWNLKKLSDIMKVPVMGVIKNNAYGHGLFEVAKSLEDNGIHSLMVGKLHEAVLLREKNISVPILNFGPLSKQDTEVLVNFDISQSVFDEEVFSLNEYALKAGKQVKVHIHVDTGLGRMGISYRQALPYIEKVSRLKGILIAGISSTFTEDNEFDKEQLRRFLEMCRRASQKRIHLGLRHLASSDGILDFPASYLDLVRPGTCLYGYYPNAKSQKEDRLSLKPVLQLKSRVVTVRNLLSGDSLSYHRKYIAKKQEKVAIVSVGYSDGYPSEALSQAKVLIHGKRYPLVAAVTANHSMVLIDNGDRVSPGDEIVFLGYQGTGKILADEISRWAGSSSYRILCGINPFLPRIMTQIKRG